ncbi:MAG: hypothetical protein KBT07_02335 [Clostridiales bacterium]|nr:hypothetical protein [Candidatus Scatonaster coprocaballi]
MNFEEALHHHLANHPKLMPQDLIKFCFQATFGAEHLLLNEERARTFWNQEYASTDACDMPLYEDLNERYVRVNLAAWKYMGKDAETLFQAFLATARTPSRMEDSTGSALSDESAIKAHFSIVTEVLRSNDFPISMDAWNATCQTYLEKCVQPVHHSVQYREEYKPAYRVIDRTLLPDGGNVLL